MIRVSTPLRSARQTLWLVWLAVVAHLGLGYISAGHAAQMLAAQGEGWVVVCTPAGMERVAVDADGTPTPDDHSPADMRLARCLACSATTFAVQPPDITTRQIVALDYVIAPVGGVTHWYAQAHAGLRPPPRAPPVLS